MRGSASIKAVLPALCPSNSELDYQALGISNGGDASNYLKDLAERTIAEAEIELLAYCKLDTLAMVKIWEVLQELN